MHGGCRFCAIIPAALDTDRCNFVMPGGCSASTPSSGSAPQGMDGGPAAAMTLRRQPPNGQTQGQLVSIEKCGSFQNPPYSRICRNEQPNALNRRGFHPFCG